MILAHRTIVMFVISLGLLMSPAEAAKRAFVVGIKNYIGFELDNGIRDANSVSTQLKNFGFTVTTVPDAVANKKSIQDNWKTFLTSVKRDDKVLVYFSGHGVSVLGRNYLVPNDADPSKINNATNPENPFIPLSYFFDKLRSVDGVLAVWIFDACRDNKFALGLPKGLSTGERSGGFEILYSAGDGQEASSNTADGNSLYTKILLQGMKQLADRDIDEIASKVSKNVAKQNPQQIPAFYSNLPVNWCFTDCDPALLKGIFFEVAANSIKKPTTLALVQTKSIKPQEFRQNAVFLGKKSTAKDKDCESESIYKHPFGCELLNDLARGNTKKYIGVNLIAKTEVYLRRRAPIVRDKLTFFCVTDTLSEGASVETRGIMSFAYSGYTYYWATVKGQQETCRKRDVAKL